MIEFEGVVLESESAKAADIWDGPGLRCLDVPVPGVTARISVVGKRAHVEVDLHAREALQCVVNEQEPCAKEDDTNTLTESQPQDSWHHDQTLNPLLAYKSQVHGVLFCP